MPHLILECSHDIEAVIDFAPLFQNIHQYLANTLPTKLSSCKSRVESYQQYFIGTDFENNSFIHLTMKILPGRSEEVKSKVGQFVLQTLSEIAHDSKLNKTAISVEVLELSEQYFKIC